MKMALALVAMLCGAASADAAETATAWCEGSNRLTIEGEHFNLNGKQLPITRLKTRQKKKAAYSGYMTGAYSAPAVRRALTLMSSDGFAARTVPMCLS